MNVEALPGGEWSSRKWAGMVLFVFAIQIGLILWLSERPGSVKRTAHRPAPYLQPAPGGEAEFIALQNPTLFALPHPKSFSGLAWLNRPAPPVQFFEWSAPPAWTPLTIEQLDSSFASWMREREPAFARTISRVPPELTMPMVEAVPGGPQQSSFRVTGELARRTLLNRFTLPPFPHNDLLTNTVVRMALGANGIPVSLALITRSGSNDADELAMDKARGLRFEPLPTAVTAGPGLLTSLTWGEVIFTWATVSLATNVSATVLP